VDADHIGVLEVFFREDFWDLVSPHCIDLTAYVPECVGGGVLEEDALPDFWGEVGADRGLRLSLHDCGCYQSARCGEFLTGGGSWYLLPLTMRVHFSTNA
jgi:hypothetical protein